MHKWLERIQSFIRDSSMDKKLMMLFMLIGLPPIILTAVFIKNIAVDSMEEQIGNYTVQITRQLSNRLDSLVLEIEGMTDYIRFDEHIQEFLKYDRPSQEPDVIQTINRTRSLLNLVSALRKDIRGIFIINDYGEIIYGATNNVINQDYSFHEQSWFQAVRDADSLQLLPPHSQDYVRSQRQVVTFAVRLTDFSEFQDRGTLLIDFDANVIYSMGEEIVLGDTGYVLMTTSSGQLIGAPDAQADLYFDDGQLQQVLAQPSGSFVFDRHRETILVGFDTSGHTGWKMIGVVPFREVDSDIRDIRLWLLFFVVLFAVLMFAAASYFSKMTTRPLKRLEQAMRRVELGNFSVRVTEQRRDEIGHLSSRFNRMLQELTRLQEEISFARIQEYRLRFLHKDSELKALQAQINPHFLYNTLNTVACIAEVRDNEEVLTVSISLAEMFKYSISGSYAVELALELNHVQCYMNIIQIRYPGRFRLHMRVPDDLRRLKLLKLILQPLVENAVNHGLIHKKGKGNIWIEARLLFSKYVVIRIRDDGIGMEPAQLLSLQERLNITEASGLEHIGLENVCQRMHMYYEGRSRVRIRSVKNKGTSLLLVLPAEEGGLE